MLRVGALRALAVARVGVSDRRAQDRSEAKPDEVVQTPGARLGGRATSRTANSDAGPAAEIVLIHRFIWEFAD